MNVFLDLDGVMADLEGHYLSTFGHRMEDAPSRNQMWRNIDKTKDFWPDIPPMAGAQVFFKWLREYCYHHSLNLYILTAAPPVEEKHMPVARHKKAWVREHLGNVMVLPSYGSPHKAAFLQDEGDVLIDDWKLNCQAWEEEGGVAIKHVGDDFASTKLALVRYIADLERKQEKKDLRRMYG